MDDKIYIYSSGERLGPFSLEEIISYTESGKFKLDTLAYCLELSQTWLTLQKVFEAFEVSIEWEYEDEGEREGEDVSISFGLEEEFEEGVDFAASDSENLTENNVNTSSLGVRPEEVQSLDSMLAHSKEFKELSESLSVFNLWKVLNIRNHEVYHEKALKWMFDQKGTHGLGSAFLRNWMIDVLEYNQNAKDVVDTNSLGPINLDYAVFKSVVERQRAIQVDGQSKRLDLLFVIETIKQGKWAIMVELKVRHVVSDDQLSSYRNWMEEEFPDHQRVLILLYDEFQDGNEPGNWPQQQEREFWIPATFSKLKNSIRETLSCNHSRIPKRETSFIEQYLENLPPLASNINLERAEILTHHIFGRYNTGIQYAITAKDTNQNDRTHWQKQVLRFMANYSSEFRLLSEYTEWKFLERELTYRLKQADWFPMLNDYRVLLNEGMDCCILFQDLDDWPTPSLGHLIVRIQLYYGSKDNLPCFRLRIRAENTPGFSEQREDLIQDFFAQLHPFPPNYGGRDMVQRETGLIYNQALQYPNHSNLFERIDGILSSLHSIWTSENFSAARKAILRHIGG